MVNAILTFAKPYCDELPQAIFDVVAAGAIARSYTGAIARSYRRYYPHGVGAGGFSTWQSY
jgi:hypothetical protein